MQSLFGLNAVNFFLGAVSTGFGPFLATYLREMHWTYSDIGIATASVGLGSLVFQIPAGNIFDITNRPIRVLNIALIFLAIGFFAIPYSVNHELWTYFLLFLTGGISAFFYPFLITIAMVLTGREHFANTMGQNQSWNHVGSVGFALAALFVVKIFGIASIFIMTGALTIFAIFSSATIGATELRRNIGKKSNASAWPSLKTITKYLTTSPTAVLIIAILLYQIANAPLTPLVGLYIKNLGGHDRAVAWAVFISQFTMIPASVFAGHFGGKIGQKLLFLTFAILPVRILLCALTTNQAGLLATQVLDGITSGVQGVAVPMVCADIAHGKRHLNLFLGIVQTAVAVGAFIGSLCQGFLTDSAGFRMTFLFFAAVAVCGLLSLHSGSSAMRKPSS